MSDTKTTYIMPDNFNSSNNDLLTASLLGNGGFGGNGMWNNPFMYLVWMYMMRWMNGGEFNNNSNCYNAMEASTQRQIQTLTD
jgi:hypothetical protein